MLNSIGGEYGLARGIDGSCAAPSGLSEIVEGVGKFALIDIDRLIGVPFRRRCRVSIAFGDELTFGFKPDFFISTDRAVACVPDLAGPSGNVVVRRLDPSGGRVH